MQVIRRRDYLSIAVIVPSYSRLVAYMISSLDYGHTHSRNTVPAEILTYRGKLILPYVDVGLGLARVRTSQASILCVPCSSMCQYTRWTY